MPRPRILVADDNPVSLRFFADALDALGFDCTLAPDGARALAETGANRFDALLLDLGMPVFGGIEVLARVRAGTGPSCRAVALATSAEMDAERIAALRAAGFADVLPKPIGIDALRATLARHLPREPHVAPVLLDDAQALNAAGGDRSIVAALRSLFVAELEALPAEVESLAATGDVAGLRDRLHRLDASAGFCGAPGLQVAIAQLRTVLGGERWPREAVDDFLVVCARVCETLATQVASDTAQA